MIKKKKKKGRHIFSLYWQNPWPRQKWCLFNTRKTCQRHLEEKAGKEHLKLSTGCPLFTLWAEPIVWNPTYFFLSYKLCKQKCSGPQMCPGKPSSFLMEQLQGSAGFYSWNFCALWFGTMGLTLWISLSRLYHQYRPVSRAQQTYFSQVTSSTGGTLFKTLIGGQWPWVGPSFFETEFPLFCLLLVG